MLCLLLVGRIGNHKKELLLAKTCSNLDFLNTFLSLVVLLARKGS
jgi:hypothetical protein